MRYGRPSNMFVANKNKLGFTLIELLITVAIISILATIGLVNYMRALTKARITKAKAEMKTIATGLESYFVDNNAYPRWWETSRLPPPAGQWAPPVSWRLNSLTTPISYLSQIPTPDPFRPWTDILGWRNGEVYDTYDYIDAQSSMESSARNIGRSIYGRMWRLASAGPDRIQTYGRSDYIRTPSIVYTSLGFYDPTNGLVSNGDIIRVGARSSYYREWYIDVESF